MTAKIIINPEFYHLEKDITRIMNGDYVADTIFRNSRNCVEKITLGDCEIVLKKYKCPNICNRLVYTFLRKSKARRAYEHAFRLIECGVETPLPVAYCEERKNNLFHTGYFFSVYLPYKTLDGAFKEDADEKHIQQLAKDFMDFTIELNKKNILHKDFNSSNIFYHYEPEEKRYRFALTDINRMRFGKRISVNEAIHSFEQLGVPAENLYKLALLYSRQRKGADVEYTMFIFLYNRMKQRIKRAFKKKAKERLRML